MEEQVCVIYAGTRGYLDDVTVENVTRYEAELLTFLRGQKKSLLSNIAEEKALTDEVESGIKDALDEFTKSFA